ncbi:mediator of DNA damage checkpoint protein 1 isoform X4 [Suricata suricatta]|uniref:mediator of DNA damage checkpoint protein 1 isoform X4 n=1 Tax=Suricata suricatta TaxID=37032 RepID=UPI0011559422|nr:mediator of DNA damage checkpoint protein 1 isoform X4 [Suricata suricatta]
MEDTQAINWEVEEEEETEIPSESLGCSMEPVGRLHIFSSAHGPEKDFPLYLGKNMVGRMPDCSVTLPFSSISKQHAVIEILAWDKAPVLQDCGSLNGTQVLRPPKVLRPGVSHRLRDQELILFADLPCQYHRVNVPLPFVARGPLTIEETPRVQGGTQPQGLLLAEDSEEEVDSPLERCVVKESRTSPLAAVVPESDEEGPSPAPDGPGPPFAFNLDSDTDEEESQYPASGEASSTSRKGSTAETEQSTAVATETQPEKDQCLVKERNNDSEVERDARKGAVPLGVILERNQPAGEESDTDVDDESRPPGGPAVVRLERAQPSDFIDSDTDVEEEGIPATPAVVPMEKRQIFHGVSTKSLQAPALVYLQESPTGSGTDVGGGEIQLAVSLERSGASVVIDSNTDDEEEVLAALALARLKESHATTWDRDTDLEEDRAQPVALLAQSQTSAGRDSNIDMEEEGLPMKKRGTVSKGQTDKAHSEKRQPPLRNSDLGVDEDKSSLGVHLERSQASAIVDINIEVEEEVPPESAVILVEKHQVPVVWTDQTDVKVEEGQAKLPVMHLEEAQPSSGDSETVAREGISLVASVVAGIKKSQVPTEEDAGTDRAAAVLECKRDLEVRAQGGSLGSQVEQDLLPVLRENISDLVVKSTSGESSQPQREGVETSIEGEREPHMDRTRDSRDSHGDSEDMDLQATQCFVERENQSLEGTLDDPWEVLATQPFCLRESEASEPKLIVAHLDAHGSCLSTPWTIPQAQHPESPVHIEPLRIQDRGMKAMGTPREAAEGVAPERGPLDRETENLPAEQEDGIGEELTRGIQVLARDTQGQESDQKMKSASIKRNMESLNIEIEIPREIQEKEIEKQTLAREILEKETEKLVLERKDEPNGLGVEVPEGILERGSQGGETEKGSEAQEGQASSPTLELGTGTGDHQGLASAPVASGRQSGGEEGVPVSPRRQQRGHLTFEMPPAEKASGGDQESTDACQPPAVPETSAPHQNPLLSQSQKHPVPHPFCSSSSSLEPVPRTRQNRNQKVPDTPLPKPKVRLRGSSRKTPSPVSSIALEPHTAIPTDQSLSADPTSQVTRGRTRRSSVRTPEPVVPTASELQPSTSKDQPVTPECTSRITRDQPIPPEPIPQANCSRSMRATRKHGSFTVPIVCEPYSAPTKPNSRPSKNQRRGAVRAIESLRTITDSALAQLPEARIHATRMQKGEAAGRSEFILEPQPKPSQSRKRPLATVDSPPLQKRLQQKTVSLKEEEEDSAERPRKEEDAVIPGSGKRKRDQTEEEPRGIPSRSLRRIKPNQESIAPKVLFTGVVDARGERAVLALGGSLANSVAEASYLVTDRVRRTVKFLCALGRGIPILSLDWLHQSRKAGCFLPPDEYVVTDPEQEKNFGFSLRDALSRARERRLLEGYEIYVTPGVQPPPPQMGEIISCCGGIVLSSMPRSYKPQRVVITCSQDFHRCSIPFRAGLPILSPEFLLTGVLKQEAKPEAFSLSTLEMSSL